MDDPCGATCLQLTSFGTQTAMILSLLLTSVGRNAKTPKMIYSEVGVPRPKASSLRR